MSLTNDRELVGEVPVTRFLNSEGNWQIVTDGPDAKCPTCGYPERHRIFEVNARHSPLIADGCPSCETSRMPDHTDGGTS